MNEAHVCSDAGVSESAGLPVVQTNSECKTQVSGSHLNPSYSGDGDQEDCHLRLVWANVTEIPSEQKKQDVVGQFKPVFQLCGRYR
jgi:hypothetical protein